MRRTHPVGRLPTDTTQGPREAPASGTIPRREVIALASCAGLATLLAAAAARSDAGEPSGGEGAAPRSNATLTFFCAVPEQLDACDRFYSGLLGLPLVMQTERARLYKANPTSFFGLTTGPARRPAPEGAIFELVYSTRREVEQMHSRVTAAGVATDVAPRFVLARDAYGFFATDPQGYRVELIHFPRLAAVAPLR